MNTINFNFYLFLSNLKNIRVKKRSWESRKTLILNFSILLNEGFPSLATKKNVNLVVFF